MNVKYVSEAVLDAFLNYCDAWCVHWCCNINYLTVSNFFNALTALSSVINLLLLLNFHSFIHNFKQKFLDSIKTNVITRRPTSFSVSKLIINPKLYLLLCKTCRALQILPRKSKFTLTQSAQEIIIIMISVMGFSHCTFAKAIATDNLTGRNIA